MPLNISNLPAPPSCLGTQWSVADLATLAHIAALVLLGRSRHAANILQGAQGRPVLPAANQKERLRQQLVLLATDDSAHRDGLLFEIICWIAAKLTTTPQEVISDPHLAATQQGTDAIKISFDAASRTIDRVTVYEHKCTDYPRKRFREEVLPAFKEYMSGARDHQLSQASISLLDAFDLTDDELVRIYDKLTSARPLAFRAALTVKPGSFPAHKCIALFKNFESIPTPIDDRFGDTFPLSDIRQWFDLFAALVWQRVDTIHV